jgi:CheY-like chemotaxis protein
MGSKDLAHMKTEHRFDLARVLVVDDDPTSRLTLQTLLQAGGYSVDAAATAAEAVCKLDEREYQLVLSDMSMESPEAGLKVIAHARMMDYKPATALVTAYPDRETAEAPQRSGVLVEQEDVEELLSQVADLISVRATRLIEREMRRN